MDTFEQMVRSWTGLTPEQQKSGMEMTRGKCLCPSCPTYTGCAEKSKELVFCATGRSFVCISDDKGCKCPGCPVTPEYGMKNQKFCLRGSEPAQRFVNAVLGVSAKK
jgi:hypothetical protein